MTHKAIVECCEQSDLILVAEPATGRRSFSAVGSGVRVYWSTSFEGGLLGLPRVITRNGHDTHARTIKEIKYLAAS